VSKQGSSLFGGKTSNKYEAYTDDEPEAVFASQTVNDFNQGISFVQNVDGATSIVEKDIQDDSIDKDNEVTEVYMMSGNHSKLDELIDLPVIKPMVKEVKSIKSSFKQSASLTPKSSITPNQTFEYISSLNNNIN
jgi:hypothetical protein